MIQCLTCTQTSKVGHPTYQPCLLKITSVRYLTAFLNTLLWQHNETKRNATFMHCIEFATRWFGRTVGVQVQDLDTRTLGSHSDSYLRFRQQSTLVTVREMSCFRLNIIREVIKNDAVLTMSGYYIPVSPTLVEDNWNRLSVNII